MAGLNERDNVHRGGADLWPPAITPPNAKPRREQVNCVACPGTPQVII